MFEARFQSFDDESEHAASAPRLAALRGEMARRDLTGFVVSRADRHQNEYLPAREERLAWLTGFTGSAGAAVVLMDRAVLFVDGRYTLQVREQADPALFTFAHLVETPPSEWIEKNLTDKDRLGYDPWLHTVDGAERLDKACAAAGVTLVPVATDPFDTLWTDRPAPPLGPVVLHDLRFAGESAEAKLTRIRAEIAKLKSGALVVSDPHAVAWTFNIRGADVAHTPLPLAFAIVPLEGRPSLYVDGRKLSNDVRHRLEALADVRAPDDFERALAALGTEKKTVRLDQATAADAIARLVTGNGGKISRGPDPIAAMKAVKNPVEIAGARAAHVRDGAAVVRFLAWLEREAPHGKLSEIAAVEALESFRRDSGLLKDISFADHLRGGPRRRHRALPRHPQDRPADRTRRTLSHRFGRPIRGRHHRHHPHRHRGRADRGDVRPLHPRAQGPHRDRARGLSREDDRRATRFVRPPVPVGGRPRLRPRHRPRRRQLSLGARRPARASPSSAPPSSSAA